MTKYLTKKFIAAGLAMAFALGLSFSGRAATTTVSVGTNGSLTFTPATININTGDTVQWIWQGPDHNTTSKAGDTTTWASTTQSAGTFSFVFPNAGSFPYECTIHAAESMFGTVNVTAPNQPPTVTLTNPAASSTFSAPANLKLGATAADSDGTVASVKFLLDGSSVATVTSAPYITTANSVAAGSHTIAAIATDNLGATATNTISVSVVTPVTVSISQSQIASGTNFQFTYSANTGLFYMVARSTNLASATWLSLSTNKAQAAAVTFVDSNKPAVAGFYRVGLMPNP